jgi:hypothetical protein
VTVKAMMKIGSLAISKPISLAGMLCAPSATGMLYPGTDSSAASTSHSRSRPGQRHGRAYQTSGSAALPDAAKRSTLKVNGSILSTK